MNFRLKAGQPVIELVAQLSVYLTEGRLCQRLVKHLRH